MEQLRKASRLEILAGKADRLSRRFWYMSVFGGQWGFVLFIVAFYYLRTFSGDWSGWNDKRLITGHVQGDVIGNLSFAVHVLLAAIMTGCGTLQLLPGLRARWPKVHRISGRAFLFTAVVLAVTGAGMVWIRGTHLGLVPATAITIDAVLIVVFSYLALITAMKRRFDQHRRWALRLFMVANGVWMLRVGYMFMGLTTGGAGIGKNMDGPFDTFWVFGCYLLPLGFLEAYFFVDSRGSAGHRLAYSAALSLASLAIFIGSLGAIAFMWWPHIAA